MKQPRLKVRANLTLIVESKKIQTLGAQSQMYLVTQTATVVPKYSRYSPKL